MGIETIISVGVTGFTTLVVCLINNHYQNNATRQLISYRLEQLEKKVDKHNMVVERTYKLEELTAIQDEKIRVANHRLDDLEKK